MSRSGYSEGCEGWALIRWRGAVKSAIRGQRGQRLLTEMLAALDAMPAKELIAKDLENHGEYCALGVLGKQRNIDMSGLDPDDPDTVAKAFNIAVALAQEIVYENDEYVNDDRWITVEICGPMRPHYPEYGRHARDALVPNEYANAQRWAHMREWVASNLEKKPPSQEEKP